MVYPTYTIQLVMQILSPAPNLPLPPLYNSSHPSTSNGTSTRSSHSNELRPPASSESSSSTNKRFSKFVDNEELALLSKGMTPANTNKNTKWVLANFEAWRDTRNRLHPTDKVPENLLHCEYPSTLNLHLSRFAIETRKTNGKAYPPKTIHQLLCGLLRPYMREIQPGYPNFLDKNDSRFKKLHGALDSHFHQLHSKGVGRDVKHAIVLTEEDEEKL